MDLSSHITILGGGIAGLSVAYYAKKKGLPFTIYEANNTTGGNCVTLKKDNFLFDSGAHRFHDKNTEATKELKKLLGKDLKKVNCLSQIYYKGRFINFPLSPLNLIISIGPYTFGRALVELIQSRLKGRESNADFQSFALYTYGHTLANRFLLNYSEKLWGTECGRLSAEIAGKRMRGLNLKTFIMEAIPGRKVKNEHLDGSFYYPKMGIGTIAKKLEEFCGAANICGNSRITKVYHDCTRILAIEVNEQDIINTHEVVSSIPLPLLIQMMNPAPPKEIMLLANTLRYRDMILVTLCLNKKSIARAATVYFPEKDFVFTRLYEPNNRSKNMSPKGFTSLVIEIPCQRKDAVWNLESERLIELVCSKLTGIGWIKKEDIIDTCVSRFKYAYPILETGCEEKVRKVTDYLKGFSNLKLTGRSGKFVYAWIHDMLRYGKEIVQQYHAEYRKPQAIIEISSIHQKYGHKRQNLKQTVL